MSPVAALKVSKAAAHAAFMAIIERITPGQGFYNDLTGRVIPTMLVPEGAGDLVTGIDWKPYVCCPLVDDAPEYEITERFVTRSFTLRAFLFVCEVSNDRRETSQVAALSNLEDDVTRAILANRKLDGTLSALLDPVGAGGSHSGWPGSKKYGECELAYRCMQKIGPDILGP